MLDRIEWIGSADQWSPYTHTEAVHTCATKRIYIWTYTLQIKHFSLDLVYADMHLYQSLLIKIVTFIHSFWEHQLSSFDGSVLKYFFLVMGARVWIHDVEFTTFSWRHPSEPWFKSDFHNSFWEYIRPKAKSRVAATSCSSWQNITNGFGNTVWKWNSGMSFG
jgi:hypothetical protein